MLKDFRDFAMKGNVVDLAIGVIIGAAFGKIVESLVADIIMPLVGAVTGGLDFSNYFLPLSKAVTASSLVDAKKQGAVLAWGNFLTIAVNFLIVAFICFWSSGASRCSRSALRPNPRRSLPSRRGKRSCCRRSVIFSPRVSSACVGCSAERLGQMKAVDPKTSVAYAAYRVCCGHDVERGPTPAGIGNGKVSQVPRAASGNVRAEKNSNDVLDRSDSRYLP